MSSSKVRVAKTVQQNQPMPQNAKGSSMSGSFDWLNRMPQSARAALMAGLDLSKHADAKKLMSEVTACMICQDKNVKKRGLCPACYRQCHRMVMMDETSWTELSMAGCCTSDANQQNHIRRAMIVERIREYRTGRV